MFFDDTFKSYLSCKVCTQLWTDILILIIRHMEWHIKGALLYVKQCANYKIFFYFLLYAFIEIWSDKNWAKGHYIEFMW
jgi:hypothetical protein